ncbi:MAG TPA: hypothetical protein VOA64_02735 [Candidatus Dormibacteraeota bacterium]|nr:hypothetical protein [Candidatus Dormibacteraeota bacterium]
MKMAAIRTVRPNVTRAEAVGEFSSRGISSLYWRMRSGPLQRIADAYVPFWFYRVRYEMIKATYTRLFALDAVDGSLDLFEFPRIPDEQQLLAMETRNHLKPALLPQPAENLLREKVLRIVFQQGFFKLRDARLEIMREPVELHLPYWLGFYGGAGIVRCRVMDAVRRRIEGAKASAFFEEWLTA